VSAPLVHVVTLKGVRPVRALTDPEAELVVTESVVRIPDGAMYTVTHRRTGRGIVRLRTLEQAADAVTGLLPLASWSEVTAQTGIASPDEHRAVIAYLKGLTGAMPCAPAGAAK
jgi:hypothetical protein